MAKIREQKLREITLRVVAAVLKPIHERMEIIKATVVVRKFWSLLIEDEKLNMILESHRPRCFACGEIDHIQKACPKEQKENDKPEAEQEKKVEDENAAKQKKPGARKRKAGLEPQKENNWKNPPKRKIGQRIVSTEDSEALRYNTAHAEHNRIY